MPIKQQSSSSSIASSMPASPTQTAVTGDSFETHLADFSTRLKQYECLQPNLAVDAQDDVEDDYLELTAELNTIIRAQFVPPVVAVVYKAMFMRLLMKGDAPFLAPAQDPVVMIKTRIRRFARVGLADVDDMNLWVKDVSAPGPRRGRPS